jgi:hypothetical protein
LSTSHERRDRLADWGRIRPNAPHHEGPNNYANPKPILYAELLGASTPPVADTGPPAGGSLVSRLRMSAGLVPNKQRVGKPPARLFAASPRAQLAVYKEPDRPFGRSSNSFGGTASTPWGPGPACPR